MRLKDVSKHKIIDSGLALILILLVAYFIKNRSIEILLIIFILILLMVFPVLFKPFAFVWSGFSKCLGIIASKIILSLVFFTMVIPIGLTRRVLRYDPMKLKHWKKGTHSVFIIREHTYTEKDFEKPY